jgi:cold shock CspA family protein
MVQSAVVTGRVVRFDETRGYGFVAPDTGEEDVFLHVNDLFFDKQLLARGTRVQFIAEVGDRGLKASQVRMVEQSSFSGSDHDRRRTADAARDSKLSDVLPASELRSELTELLLTSIPALTAEQVLLVRTCLISFAVKHGWAGE